MCSIIGYHSNTPTDEHRYIIKKLMRESVIRGQHAYGLTYRDRKQYRLKKYFQDEYENIDFPITSQLIFHSRYSTSGDFRIHENNQPLQHGETHLVFNGVIDMGVEFNDGILVLNNGTPDKMLEFITGNKCSFAGLLLHGGKLYGFRNPNRPAWVLKYEDATFIASTKDIFHRALGNVEPVEMTPNELYVWH